MKVNSTHPQYNDSVLIWQRCRVAYEGEDAVKDTGEDNLPKPTGLTDDEYKAYKVRAQYPSFMSRTIESFIGLSMDKEPVIEMAPAMEEYMGDIGGPGIDEKDLIRRSLRHNFTVGRLGMLVGKMDELDHPHIALYNAESIINWSDDFIVLKEEYYKQKGDDPYVLELAVRYRVLKLNDNTYVQEIWEGSGSKFRLAEVIEFRDSRNQTIDFIPFVFVGVDGVDNKISKPILLDFVNTSMSWYRNSADIEHGLHFTSLPVYFVSGVSGGRDEKSKSDTIQLGSNRALKLRDPQAKVGVVEFRGAGMKSLEDRMAGKEAHMGELGAKILMDNTKGVEAAETKKLRGKSDTSLAANVINSVARGIENCLRYIAQIEGFTDEVDVTINTELVADSLSDGVVALLLKAAMADRISQETFLEVLKTGKLPEDFDVQEELDRLEAQGITDEETIMDGLDRTDEDDDSGSDT